MVIYAAEGCSLIFKSELVKRDPLAKRHGRSPVKALNPPRFLHSRGDLTGDGAPLSTYGYHEDPFLNTFLSSAVSSPNVRITGLKTVRTAKEEPRKDDEPGLNFIWRVNDPKRDQLVTSRAKSAVNTPRNLVRGGNQSERCWTAPLSQVPRGAKMHDKREMAYVANVNLLAKSYKEQSAALFFSKMSNTENDASARLWPDSLAANRAFALSGGSGSENVQSSALPLQLPSSSFEECPEAWHVYAVQCFLSGDQVMLRPSSVTTGLALLRVFLLRVSSCPSSRALHDPSSAALALLLPSVR